MSGIVKITGIEGYAAVGWAEKPSAFVERQAGLFSPAYFCSRIVGQAAMRINPTCRESDVGMSGIVQITGIDGYVVVGWAEKPSAFVQRQAGLFSPAYFC